MSASGSLPCLIESYVIDHVVDDDRSTLIGRVLQLIVVGDFLITSTGFGARYCIVAEATQLTSETRIDILIREEPDAKTSHQTT